MKSEEPKQFLLLSGRPILMHTINKFASLDYKVEIILVLPQEKIPDWEDLIAKHSFNQAHRIIAGGKTRFESVNNGLSAVSEGSLVAIHDGVRPLTSKRLIDECFSKAEEHGSGVAAVNSKDSIRKIAGNANHNVPRADYKLMQTPQTFQSTLIKEAFANYSDEEATDDATIAEKNGLDVQLVEGEYTNLKITTPEDLVIAQALLNNDLVR